jgi:hypothetical protein
MLAAFASFITKSGNFLLGDLYSVLGINHITEQTWIFLAFFFSLCD